LRKYFPKEKSCEKKTDDNDGDNGKRKFVERNGENAECPEKSEPKQGTFFVYLLRETDIEIAT
jgi:hypothetical protein